MNAIEVHNLKKYYGKIKAVNNISFDINKGEIFGFLGPNGAGKTTTIRCMMDFIRPSSGSITILDKDAQKDSVEIKNNIGYLSDTPHLNERWTGKTHIQFLQKFSNRKDISRDLIERLTFDPYIKVKKLSSGNKKKLSLILALMSQPDIIILDEPTSALDPLLQNVVYELLEEARERGATVFMSSHNLNEVERVCDRVGIIKKGKLVEINSITYLKEKRIYSVRINFDRGMINKDKLIFDNVTVIKELRNGLMLRVKGDISPLLNQLCQIKLEDIEITRASLEDIFMEYYKT